MRTAMAGWYWPALATYRTNLVSKREWALSLTRRQTYDTHTTCGPREHDWAFSQACTNLRAAQKLSWRCLEMCSFILLLLTYDPLKYH
jgi:hypothetical protein